VPDSYDSSQRTPTLFNIHGLMSNGSQQVGLSDMNPTSDAAGYIVVYPEGQQSSWNGGSCCGGASSSNLDDTGFLKAVAADVQEVLCVDPRRIYAIGMSNGGYMTHRLACEASDVFAAFAPVAGAMGIPDCTPARPVPILAFHGVQDTLVAYSAGQEAMAEWVEHNGCSSTSTTTDVEDDVSCERWDDCEDGSVVEFCTLDPMGHCWPGGGETPYCLPLIGPYNDYEANPHILEFLSNYTLP
jgi:polyhydroxybutyrate depolymerase